MRASILVAVLVGVVGCGRGAVLASGFAPDDGGQGALYVTDSGYECTCEQAAVHSACLNTCEQDCAKKCGYDGTNHCVGCFAPVVEQCCVESHVCDCDP